MNKELNFVLASDENYADKLSVTMYSILSCHRDAHRVSVHILSNNITEESLNKIKEVSEQFDNGNIVFYNLNNLKELIGKSVNVDHLSLAAYARLFIPTLLPVEVDRAVYLDVDILVNENMYEVFDMDLDDNYIGAVKSLIDLATDEEMKNGLLHINSGMIVWNLKICREKNFVGQCLDYIKNHEGKIKFHDQTIINEICKGKIKALHPKYNVMSNMLYLRYNSFISVYGLTNFYNEKEYEDAKARPTVIHLTSWVVGRPWEIGCVHPYKDKYHEILSKTPWKNKPLIYSKKTKMNFIKRFTYRVLPGSLIRRLTSIKRQLRK